MVSLYTLYNAMQPCMPSPQLLDRGAEVNMQNKVISVIIHSVHAMQHVPRVPSISGGYTCVY